MLRTIRKENPGACPDARSSSARRRRSTRRPIWGDVAEKLARSRHQHPPVNVGHLDRLVEADQTVVVPGKLLAAGRLSKSITVAAFHYSEEARSKIHSAGGRALSIHELLKAKPDGSGVRLLG